MIIAITTIAAVAAAVFGTIQTKKLKEANEIATDKDAMNRVLRSHMTNVESELKAANDYIKSLRSELQSCKDKAKSSAAKAVKVAKATEPAVSNPKTEKAAPVLAPAKPRKPYKKKEA